VKRGDPLDRRVCTETLIAFHFGIRSQEAIRRSGRDVVMQQQETSGRKPWAVSLHGGHSGQFCDHGHGTLRAVIEAAVAAGYHTFGVTEHAPRVEPRHLFPEEIALAWDAPKLMRDFEEYAAVLRGLAEEFADRLDVLRGFEIEVVPHDRYVDLMTDLRERFGFEYTVGSVHWIDDIVIDYKKPEFDRAAARYGGPEGLAVEYYGRVREMVAALRPEVVGHPDLPRKFAVPREAVETPRVREAAGRALDTIAEVGSILDVNTAPLRKGEDMPYPAPWLVEMALARRIPFCFGDDSHRPSDVGGGVPEARQYLLDNGVNEITYLAHEGERLMKKVVPLA